MEIITSISNEKVQYIKKLVKDKSLRKSENKFVVEGANIIKDLPKYVSVISFFVESTKIEMYRGILEKYDSNIVYSVNDKVMCALSDTSTPSGILCVVENKTNEFENDGNLVVLDGISDPGNFGTIMRTCVACGVKNIIAINCTDYTAPKVVRSSMGGIFRLNIYNLEMQKALEIMKGYNVLSLDMNGISIYENKDIKQPFALVVGSEAHGVSKTLKDRCDTLLSLPMVGDIESLNAAVSLSVALYHLSFA